MKRISLLASWVSLSLLLCNPAAAETKYWDTNGSTPGATVGGYADGSWDAVTANWSTSQLGDVATGVWSPGDDAIFSAGNDVPSGISEAGAIINVIGTQTANSVTIANGHTKFVGGAVDTGTNTVTVKANAILNIDSSLRLNSAGKVVLDGGTLVQSNSSSAGSIISAAKSLEVSALGGTIAYLPGDGCTAGSASSKCVSIYGPTTGALLGTGGTTTNGVGTLTYDSPTEFRIQNSGTANSTYAKLVVKQGLVRLGSVTSGTPAVQQTQETALGAVPAAPLADAITLDGGRLGASFAVTLHANRGVKIGPNGGSFDAGGGMNEFGTGGGTITVPGPLSGSGTLTVRGISNTTGNRTGGLTLSNANNVSTFSGNVVVQGSILTLAESLVTPNFSGDSTLTVAPAGLTPTTPTGLVSIAASKTFTVGSDNASTSYDGGVGGAGTFVKVGSGTLTLNTATGGTWTNTGGVVINGGGIRFGTQLAGFGNSTPVTVNNGASLDMNSIPDTFGALVSDAGNTTGQVIQGAGNLTLAGAAGTTTYAGTITSSGGTFTKSAGSTQILSGNNTLGAVAANNGTLLFNGTNTATSVTVGAPGTLGGSGSISGGIANSGIIAPGSGGVGTFTSNGLVTMATGSRLAIDLSGATADKLAVLGNLDLSAADNFLDITGAGSGSSWIIGSYTGTLTGVFENITSGYSVTYGSGTNSVITLTASSPAGQPGDFNEDTKVDAADYTFWRDRLGSTTPLPNDNGLGTPVSNAHYTLWKTNFGAGAGSGALAGGAVPEPATGLMVLLGALGLSIGVRRK